MSDTFEGIKAATDGISVSFHRGKTRIAIDDTMCREVERRWNEHPKLVAALKRIAEYPVHSEPVGGALDMQDIATAALAAYEGKT